MFTRQDLRNSLTSFKPESTMFLSSVSHDQVGSRSIGIQMTVCLCDSCYFPKESHHRGPTQCVCVADCYYIVNVLDLPFASPIAIYR